MARRDTSGAVGLRVVAAVSVVAVALVGVGAPVVLLAGGLDPSTLAVAAVVFGSVCALGLYATRTARRTETPYWRS